jgi:hypothetical protein
VPAVRKAAKVAAGKNEIPIIIVNPGPTLSVTSR